MTAPAEDDAQTYQGPPRTRRQVVEVAMKAIIAQRQRQRCYAEVLIANEDEYGALQEHFNRINIGYALTKRRSGYSRNIVIISWKN